MKLHAAVYIAGAGLSLLGLRTEARAQCAAMPAGTQRQTMQSMFMGGAEPFVVYLPPDYATGTKRYPVVYWFYGRGDTECTQLPLPMNIPDAITTGCASPMIYES